MKKGERIAQLILERNSTPDIEEVKDLKDSDRGGKGFGSTGGHAQLGKVMEQNETLIAMIDKLREESDLWINSKTTNSIEFHLQHNEQKETVSLTEQIPREYHEFINIFDEHKADRFPES